MIMRSFIVVALLATGVSNAVAEDFKEVRNLELGARGFQRLFIDAGAGSLDVTGVDGLRRIEVRATIVIPDVDENAARDIIDGKLRLSLESLGDAARLQSRFRHGFWGRRPNARVDLEVRIPADLALAIDDTAGSINVTNVTASVWIDDSSGAIAVRRVGDLRIHDGSGSIEVTGVNGDVFVDDGSGDILVQAVGGSVTIDDGSGDINVSNVGKELVILNDGSGDVSSSDVRGSASGE